MMNMDLLENLQLDHEGMAKAIGQHIEHILNQGGDDSARLAEEVVRTPDDVMAWFDLGVAITDDVNMLDYLMAQKFQMENPGAIIEEDTPYADEGLKRQLYEKALKCFDKVLELAPDYYGVQYQKGVIYANMQQFAEAEACFLQALKDDEEDLSAAHDLAMVYRDLGDEERCNHYLRLAERMAEES